MTFQSKPLIYKLDTARDNFRVEVKGGYIVIVGASSANAMITMAIDNNISDGDGIDMSKGDKWTYGPGFEKLYITHAAQPGEWIKIVVAPSKDIFDFELGQNFSVDSILNTVTVAPEPGAIFVVQDEPITNWAVGQVTVDTTADLIIAANTDRESVAIQAGTLDLYVGTTSGVTASNGFKIPANSSHVFTHMADIYGIRASSSAVAYYSEQEE